jgi:hypothetical protein
MVGRIRRDIIALLVHRGIIADRLSIPLQTDIKPVSRLHVIGHADSD